MKKNIQISIIFFAFVVSAQAQPVIEIPESCSQKKIVRTHPYRHDYSQTWTTKMFLALPDGRGGCDVKITFGQALEIIRRIDTLTLGVPKIIYLVGWQYNGHDDKYPAFFEVNPALKRKEDATAEESLRWLMREARKYHTAVSLHINMTDAYDNSPLWQEYVENDLISKNGDGSLKIIGEYNKLKAYQVNYRNEWEKGYTQMRINRLLQLLPELKDAATIHIDAWLARPSEGHNESAIMEADYQRKAARYWNMMGLDVTSEYALDYMTGYLPLAWHNGFKQYDYLHIPADVYTGVGVNADTGEMANLGFLFGVSSYGEPIWKTPVIDEWIHALTRDFTLKCPQYFYLNRLKRLGVEGSEKNRTALYSDRVSVSLADSTVKQQNRILRRKNTVSFPAVWRDDAGVIIYTDEPDGKYRFDIPFEWGDARSLTLYQFTSDRWQLVGKIKIKDNVYVADLKSETLYYAIPSEL
ncbi:MAG: endo-alpha-N-acetylgalactosaminidase family protein [Prevotellaceae bacterium]|nr:endo-alpha-N-acetylgalactosaminidase family protein [Prevotellaceae bacterium]